MKFWELTVDRSDLCCRPLQTTRKEATAKTSNVLLIIRHRHSRYHRGDGPLCPIPELDKNSNTYYSQLTNIVAVSTLKPLWLPVRLLISRRISMRAENKINISMKSICDLQVFQLNCATCIGCNARQISSHKTAALSN